MASDATIDLVLLSSVKETQRTLGSIVTKPALVDKLLMKAPFRFLLDVVKACTEKTGFPAGLFTADYILKAESKEVTREIKLALLDRLIACIGLANNRRTVVSSLKIIAGAEPIQTNAMLQDLASAVDKLQSGSFTMESLVARVDAGEQPSSEGVSIPFTPANIISAPVVVAPVVITPVAPVMVQQAAVPVEMDALTAVLASNDATTPDWVVLTQRSLQPLFEKPRLLGKHLVKPPFAFIHDIVRSVIKSTGFFDGLFPEVDLDRESLKDAKQRATFLKRMLEAVAVASRRPLVAQPANILAGKEPEQTCLVLQQLGQAIASGVRFSDVLSQMKKNEAIATIAAVEPVAVVVPAASVVVQPVVANVFVPVAVARMLTPSGRPVSRGGGSQATAAAATLQKQQAQAAQALAVQAALDLKQQQLIEQQQLQEEQNAANAAAALINQKQNANDDEAPPQRVFERPRTARRAPPKVKSNLEEEKVIVPPAAMERKNDENGNSGSATASSSSGASQIISGGVLLDGDTDGDLVEEENDGAGGEDGAGGADGRPVLGEEMDLNGAGKLKREIEKNLSKAPKKKDDSKPSGGVDKSGSILFSKKLGDKGDKVGLVRAEQKRMNEQLREWVQKLCQCVHPLGKCVDFVHEDLEIMQRELARWQRDYQQQSERLQQEQKITDDQLEPLRRQLAALDRSLADQQRQIRGLNGSILRNEDSLRQTMELQAQGAKM